MVYKKENEFAVTLDLLRKKIDYIKMFFSSIFNNIKDNIIQIPNYEKQM
jgi:hypothetical protein